MGAKFSQARLHVSIHPFMNLPKATLMKVLTAYHNLSDGFGLSSDEFREILIFLSQDLKISNQAISLLIQDFFTTLDTDHNGLVDGMEFLAALSVVSGMTKLEIIEFNLSLVDFNNVAALSFDELMLILKLTVNGLIKVTDNYPDDNKKQAQLIDEKRLENIASQVYKQLHHVLPIVEQISSLNYAATGMRNVEIERRSIKDISEKLLTVIEVCTWLEYYNNTGIFYNNKQVSHALTRDVIQQIRPCFLYPSTHSENEYAVIQGSLGVSFLANEEVQSKALMKNGKENVQHQWKSQTALLTPTSFANKTFSTALPPTQVTVDWIYGFECNNCNNLLYSRNSDLVYTTGKYAIVYNVPKHSQSILSHHNTQILCLTLSPDLLYAATGDDGGHSRFIVWDVDTLEIMYESMEFFQDGVVQLCFNPTGDIIIAVDRSSVKTLVAVAWRSNQILFKDSIECKICMGVTILNKNTIVMAKDDEILFWKNYSEGYVQRKSVFLPNRSKEVITSLLRGFNNEILYAGTLTGKILLLQNINISKEVNGHIGIVSSLCLCKDGFLSAGHDSKIRSWNATTLESRFIYDVSRFASVTHIQSTSMSYDNTSILFGTKGGDIFEISALDGSDLRGGPILQAHHNNFSTAPSTISKIVGMDVHPSKYEYVTVGNDNTLRIIDIKTKMTLKICKLNVNITYVAYSPIGDAIAVGTTNTLQEQGMCLILNEETLQILTAMRDSQVSTTCLKYSPDGDTLCVAAADGSILFYSVNDDYELLAKAKKHSGPVISIDFTIDGEFIRSNSYNHELYFFNVDDGSHQSNISSLRDVQWHSQHCLFTWHTKAMHDERVFDHVTSCITPNLVKLSTVSEEGTSEYDNTSVNTVVNGSSLGIVRFYPYPLVEPNSECIYYHAHVGPAGYVRYSFDNSYLFSIGEDDRVVVQFLLQETIISNERPYENIDPANNSNAVASTLDEGESGGIARAHQLEEMAFEFLLGAEIVEQTVSLSNTKASLELFHQSKSLAHPRFQWIEKSLLPSTVLPLYSGINFDISQYDVNPSLISLPDKSLHLQHVHGIEGKTCRNNLTYSMNQNEIVYTVGSYGIVFNMDTRAQKIYKLHSNHITAFAVNKEGTYVCTGEVGCPFARVAVWNTATCQTVVVLAELQIYSVVNLAFSNNGKLLAIASNDRYHCISVYDWQKNICLSKFSTKYSKILGLSFFDADQGLCVVGVDVALFWYNIATKFPYYLHADYSEMVTNKQAYLGVIEFQTFAVTATSEGMLIVFEKNKLKQVTQAHIGPVYAISTGRKGDFFATGGYDGSVRIWNTSFTCVHEFNMAAVSKCHANIVRSVAISPDNSAIVVGLQGGEVVELNIKDANQVKEINIKGHTSAVYGLAAHPRSSSYVTTGDDGILRIWDTRKRGASRSLKLELSSRAVSFSPDGHYLVIGYGPTNAAGKKVKKQKHAKEGSFTIISFDNLRVVAEIKDSALTISTIKFSSNNKFLIIGSEDNKVYIYQQNSDDPNTTSYSLKHSLNNHLAPIENIEISYNNQFMISKDIGNNIFYTVLMTGSPVVNAEDIKDEMWSFYDLPQAWYSISHWLCQLPEHRHGRDKTSAVAASNIFPVAVKRSNTAQLLASGNNTGDLLMSNFPSYDKQKTGLHFYANAHTGPVSALAFTYLDSHLISISSQDCCVLQFKLVSSSSHAPDPNKNALVNLSKSAPSVSYDYAKDVFSNVHMSINKDGDKSHHWSGLIIDPSKNRIKRETSLEKVATAVEFIYGTQRNGLHPCVYYNSNYQIVYTVGNSALIYNKSQHKQLYYTLHNQEITASAINSIKSMMATGDRGLSIHVWDALIGGKCIKQFDHAIYKYSNAKVVALIFGNEDKHLFAVCSDSIYYSLYIFYSASSMWYDGIYMNSVTLSNLPLYTMSYNNANHLLYIGGSEGLTYSINVHSNGFNSNVVHNKYRFNDLRADVMCSIPFDYKDSVSNTVHNAVIYGCREGFLYIVSTEANEILQKISGHLGSIGGLTAIDNLFNGQEGDYLLSSGYDHCLKLWSNSMVLVACYECNKLINRNVIITSTCYNPVTHTCLAYTLEDEMYEISLFSASEFLIATSHLHKAATYGLAIHPLNKNIFCTVGDEGKVLFYHSDYRYVTKHFALQYGSRAITFSENGKLIIAGLGIPGKENVTPKDGTIVVYSAETNAFMYEERKAKGYITSIQCAGEFIVFSSFDSRVYVVNTSTLNTFAVLEMSANKHPCLGIDIDVSKMFIRAMYSFKKIAYYDLETNKHEEDVNKIKDVEWRTHNCFYHWNTQGLFASRITNVAEGVEARVVVCMAINHVGNLLAVAYANGGVKLFTYPVIEEFAPFQELTRVSSFASCLAFTADDAKLLVLDAYSGYLTQIAVKEYSI